MSETVLKWLLGIVAGGISLGLLYVMCVGGWAAS